MSHIIKIAAEALPTVKSVVAQQILYCKSLIYDFPNPSWGSRPINYKSHPKQDGAAEKALEIMSDMLLLLQHEYVLDYQLTFLSKNVFPTTSFLVNYRHADKQPTTKDMILKFEENIKNGLFTFNV